MAGGIAAWGIAVRVGDGDVVGDVVAGTAGAGRIILFGGAIWILARSIWFLLMLNAAGDDKTKKSAKGDKRSAHSG